MNTLPKLAYPKKSHRKLVRLPRESKALAEIFGIMLGDGGINNDWQATISLNSIKDKEYAIYIISLINDLFNVQTSLSFRKNSNTVVIRVNSTSVVDFLVTKGLHRGNKLKAGLHIPEWIMKQGTYRKACLRGLVDTDGCLFIHHHKSKWDKMYHNLGLTFTSYSPLLIKQVAEIMTEHDLVPRITKRGRDIYLYRAESVSKYLSTIGTSNQRIRLVYNTWRDARAV